MRYYDFFWWEFQRILNGSRDPSAGQDPFFQKARDLMLAEHNSRSCRIKNGSKFRVLNRRLRSEDLWSQRNLRGKRSPQGEKTPQNDQPREDPSGIVRPESCHGPSLLPFETRCRPNSGTWLISVGPPKDLSHSVPTSNPRNSHAPLRKKKARKTYCLPRLDKNAFKAKT